MNRPRPVPWVAALQPAVHGSVNVHPPRQRGPLDRRGGRVLDFSVNGNVIGPPAAALRAIAQVDVSLYPDRSCSTLRRAIAELHAVVPESVVCGNGTTELIWAIARAFLGPGDPALVAEPTYGEYAVACAAAGALVHRVRTDGPGAPLDVPALSAAVERHRPRVVWLCHPNNPTGAPLAPLLVQCLAARALGTLFVVDEAYLTLCTGVESCLPLVATGQVLVLRSLTKDRALAGVRVGYGVADPAIVSAVGAATPPWSVSSLAQGAALAAIADGSHLGRAREAVADSRVHLFDGLRRLGLQPYPSVTNFVLVPVGDGSAVTSRLLALGFAVRDCTSFGLPHCIRIGVRSIGDQERLLVALAEVLSSEGP